MISLILVEEVIPKWTKKVVTDLGGRDPLGLSRVSQLITDYLLTGIITTTDRARYYSYYCWALWHIDKEDVPEKYQMFVDGFRWREAAMALATLINDPEASMVGVKAVRSHLDEAKEENEINCDFRVLPSNPLGGYGQYYSGCLYYLGLTHRPEDGIDRITEGEALRLAQCFHAVIEKTPYISKQLFRAASMPLSDLSKSKERLTLDAILEPFATEERTALVELFFGLNKQTPDESTIFRRHTLAHILYIISEYEKHGSLVNAQGLDNYLVYPVYYYDSLWLTDKETLAYKPPKTFEISHSFWKQFCLHQFFIQAIEGLMYSLLETLSGESEGLKPDEAVSRLLQPEFFLILKDFSNKRCGKPYDLLASLNLSGGADEETSLRLQKGFSLLNAASEFQILNLELSPPEEAARAILILAIIYGKWRGIRNNIGFNWVSAQAGSELWTGAVFPYLDAWLNQEISWVEAMRVLLETFVIAQHDRIRWERRRLDSCWLRRDGERIFKDQDYWPRHRSSRHRNAVRILRDLALLRINEAGDIAVNSDGKQVLAKIME